VNRDLVPWIRTFGAGILPTPPHEICDFAGTPAVAADPGVPTCAPVLTHSASALRSGARGAYGSTRHSGNPLGVTHGSRS
jgi:hypothetical protein